MSGFKEYVYSFIMSILNGYDANLTKAMELLTTDIFQGELFEFTLSVSSLIMPVALEIAQILFLIHLYNQMLDFKQAPFYAFIKSVMIFLTTKMILSVSVVILSYIYLKATQIITSIGTNGSALGTAVGILIEPQIADMGFFEMLGLISTSVIILIAMMIIGFIVQAIAYGRMFEILLYVGTAPIPLAFIAEEGQNGRVARNFLLRYGAVCLQGVFMIMAFKIYTITIRTTFASQLTGGADIFGLLYTMLLASLVLIMAIVKSGSYATKLLDV